jgi:uncharacterized protein
MPALYPSWIEIPVTDLVRALLFYRTVFGLTETPIYDEPPAEIAVLLPSEKSVRQPGVSLVRSPLHKPGDSGAIINFHLETHAALDHALHQVIASGGEVDTAIVDTGDGVRYVNLLDCEGNRIALSAYEPFPDDE